MVLVLLISDLHLHIEFPAQNSDSTTSPFLFENSGRKKRASSQLPRRPWRRRRCIAAKCRQWIRDNRHHPAPVPTHSQLPAASMKVRMFEFTSKPIGYLFTCCEASESIDGNFLFFLWQNPVNLFANNWHFISSIAIYFSSNCYPHKSIRWVFHHVLQNSEIFLLITMNHSFPNRRFSDCFSFAAPGPAARAPQHQGKIHKRYSHFPHTRNIFYRRWW